MKMLQTLVSGIALSMGAAAQAVTVDEVIDRMIGDYQETATSLHAQRVSLDHTDDAVYIELIVRGAETQVRQMVLTFLQRGDEVEARVNIYDEEIGEEFVQDLRVLTLGLWAAPDMFPKLLPNQLDPVVDVRVEDSSEGVRLAFTNGPAVLYGAQLLDCDILFAGDHVDWERNGRDRLGEQLWNEDVVLDRVELESPVTRFDNGLVTIDIREGKGVSLADGDQIAFDYIGVLQDGRRFDSTQFKGRSMYASAFPGGIHPELARGLVGIQCPTSINDESIAFQPIRKIIMPPDIAFGETGLGPIPPNSTLYYIAMVQSIRDRTPDAPASDDE